MSALSDGTLLAVPSAMDATAISRSGDGGATWTRCPPLGNYRMLTPRNFAELDGTVYLLEYQAFTVEDVPIRLYASTDRGRTWEVRYTFSGHRHGHGLAADPARHALWAFFGDTRVRRAPSARRTGAARGRASPGDGRTCRRRDGARGWQPALRPGHRLSAAAALYRAAVARMGTYVELALLPGPSYSTFASGAGGFVVGSAREPGGDIYPLEEESAHVWVSLDSSTGRSCSAIAAWSLTRPSRADVYYELPSGLLILQLQNARGFGPGGHGYQLLRLTRR